MSSDNTDPVILSAVRTPIGSFQKSLKNLTAPELGAIVIREALQRAGIDGESVDEVIMGQVLQGGVGQAPARQAALGAGLPAGVPATTINKVCGSGLKSVMLASSMIKAGDGSVFVAGGQESMSNAPYFMKTARSGLRLGNAEVTDMLIHDGLWCAIDDCHMGDLAEYTAEKASITREELDAFSADSQRKAAEAQAAGKFTAEIVPVEIPQRKGDPIVVSEDEYIRPETTAESLGRLRPAFIRDGIVTAGNASGINDGASALVVTSRAAAEEAGAPVMARITGYTQASVEAKDIFFAPISAIRKLMEQMGTSIGDYDLIEANEAFAAQALADGKELGWDWDRVNIHGGSIALGHPIGASGARVLTTLIYALKDRGLKTGLASLCLGGGGACRTFSTSPSGTSISRRCSLTCSSCPTSPMSGRAPEVGRYEPVPAIEKLHSS
ncbi:acetyl-CoA C-acetyltransferase [Gemmatimonadota bacterium]